MSLFFIALVFLSCKTGQSPTSPPTKEFSGTWQVYKYIDTYDSTTENGTIKKVSNEENVSDDMFTIEDNKIISLVSDETCSSLDTFSFELSGNKLHYIELLDTVDVEINSSEMILTMISQNNSIEVVRKVYSRKYDGSLPPENWPTQICSSDTISTLIIPWNDEEDEEDEDQEDEENEEGEEEKSNVDNED
jgi:hypothetical protein